MALELAWNYFMKEHALSYCSVDFPMKLSQVTFPDLQITRKLSCNKQKGKLVSYRAELLL